MPKADLHTHSTCSDGTSSPAEVAAAAWRAGVRVYALADHDTVSGVQEAAQECQKRGMDFIPAVEISTREHDHLHFLGFNVDVTNPEFLQFLQHNRQLRVTRIQKIIAQLQAAGVNITPQDVFKRAENTVSRAHVADALKANGVVDTRQEGFRQYLVPGKAGYVPSEGVTVIEAIRRIKHAGGLAVIAHPGIVSEYWNFPAWTEAGLDGIEVFYPAHTYTMRQELLAVARKYNLFATCGSDYHGPKSGRTTAPGMEIPQSYYDKLLRKLLNK